MSKLQAWLSERHMSHEAFADMIGTDRSAVTRYVNGRMPRQHILRKIVEATDGAVTANDFVVAQRECQSRVTAQGL